MRVHVLKPHVYAGIRRLPGELYDMDERFVAIMLATQNVETVASTETREIQPQKPAKQYLTRHMTPKDER
jgi:hypothetical protein